MVNGLTDADDLLLDFSIMPPSERIANAPNESCRKGLCCRVPLPPLLAHGILRLSEVS